MSGPRTCFYGGLREIISEVPRNILRIWAWNTSDSKCFGHCFKYQYLKLLSIARVALIEYWRTAHEAIHSVKSEI